MTLIGNTVREVRRFLDLAGPRRKGAAVSPVPNAKAETRGMTIAERELLGRFCSRCGALNELCLSETGLPASGPHRERIRESG